MNTEVIKAFIMVEVSEIQKKSDSPYEAGMLTAYSRILSFLGVDDETIGEVFDALK